MPAKTFVRVKFLLAFYKKIVTHFCILHTSYTILIVSHIIKGNYWWDKILTDAEI